MLVPRGGDRSCGRWRTVGVRWRGIGAIGWGEMRMESGWCWRVKTQGRMAVVGGGRRARVRWQLVKTDSGRWPYWATEDQLVVEEVLENLGVG